MSDPATIIRRYVEGWRGHDTTVFEELLAPDFTDVMHGSRRSREQLLADVADRTLERWTQVEQVVVDGDLVAARMTSTLTHPESGRRASITGTVMLRIVDGRIVEGWGEHDRLGQLQQMGVVPSGADLRPWIRERLGTAATRPTGPLRPSSIRPNRTSRSASLPGMGMTPRRPI